jgi:hypothetical protein
MVLKLRSSQAYQAKGNPNAPGHRPPAEEIADLLARFPGVDIAAPPVTRPIDTVPASAADPIRAPSWKAGDQWTYWWSNPTGAGTFVWTMDREERVDGHDDYVVRLGTQREFFIRKSDLAVHLEKTSGEVQVRYTPPEPRYPWPLTLGAGARRRSSGIRLSLRRSRPALRSAASRRRSRSRFAPERSAPSGWPAATRTPASRRSACGTAPR